MTSRQANPPRRNHFVAVMMLNRFANAENLLWVFDKRSLEIRRSTSEAIFFKNDFHTFVRSDGSKDTSLEEFFAKLEGEANDVIVRICAAARSGKLPELSAHERRVWDSFLYYQWKRTPDFLRGARFDHDFDGVLQEVLEDFEAEFRALSEEERQLVAKPEFLKTLKHNARVNALRDEGSIVRKTISALGLGIGRIVKANKSFVIGTKPVVKLGPQNHAVLGDPDVEVWLPIASDIVVCMVANGGRELLVEMDDKRIRDFNELLLKQSTAIASGSLPLMMSLTKARVRGTDL